MSSSSKWVVRLAAREKPLLRLICVPYAGGNAQVFRPWGGKLPPWVELFAVDLPGRGGRFSEPPLLSLSPIVEQLGAALLPLLTQPYAVFGHSMGALIAFETVRWLKQRRVREPKLLVVSGRSACSLPPRRQPLHGLSDDAFLAAVREFNGIPEEVLASAELREMVLGVLRADFTVGETYRFHPTPVLDCPLRVMVGDADPSVPRDSVEPWAELTRATTSISVFRGDHFFLRSQEDEVIALLQRDLEKLVL